MARRLTCAIVAFGLLAFVAGCDGDEEDETTGAGEPIPTFPEEPSDPFAAYYEEDFATVPAEQPPPPLTDPAVQTLAEQLIERVRENVAAAMELGVDPADVAAIREEACVSPEAAADSLSQIAPGADLSALTPVNRISSLVAVDCDPFQADAFSSAAYAHLLDNTDFTNPPEPVQSQPLGLTLAYRGACSAMKRGVSTQVRQRLNLSGVPARFGVALAVGAAFNTCPEELAALFD
jgi:hypothetical protein